tara:strand:- start:2109 stop:2984 length:876 start_codon:yes stop_codon:yes gene_type:complete
MAFLGPLFAGITGAVNTIVAGSNPGGGSGLQNKEEAAYPSYQEFLAFSKQYDQSPSLGNLFSVHFAAPRILQNNLTIQGGSKTTRLDPGVGNMRNLLNLYCQSVNLPSKQVTTGAVQNVGTAVKYATSAAYSQLNMTFIMPKSQQTRIFFERWVSRMAPDANQYTEFYDNYICPSLRIYKWERGGGEYVNTDAKMLGFINKNTGDPIYNFKKHKVTAMYEIRNLFPYNIGSIQLNNDTSRVTTLTVGFLYERYRVAVEDDFTDDGRYKHRVNTSQSVQFLPQLVNNSVGDF